MGNVPISTRNKVAAGLISVAAAGTLVAYGLSGSDQPTTAAAKSVTVADSPSGDSPSPTPSAAVSPSASPSASASTSASPSPSPSASHSASRSASAAPTTQAPAAVAKAAPAPVAKPGPVAPPPPVTAPRPPTASCKTTNGTAAPLGSVSAALTAAAGKSRTLTLNSGGTDKLPPLPANLLKAIAWQESGWQSNITACDGGIGTMQIMPATVTWMNGKFGTSNDVHTLAGNTDLGAQLLDELVAYYGDSSFGGKYDLAPDPTTGKTPLLDLVIAAYNAGAGNVHYNTTTTTVTDPAGGSPTSVTIGTSVIPNPGYVANVKALMTNCSCLSQ